jgi:thymidylate synthase (FAD)
MKLENNGLSVELVGHYGGDESHAMSAWTSTAREITDEKRGRIDKLLNMLADAGHHTPFEKSMLHFVVTTDIATHIHLIKHRIGVAVNAESARYKELKDDKSYIPDDWPVEIQMALEDHLRESQNAYHDVFERLVDHYVKEGHDKSYARKRAKESSRFFLPYATCITADVAFNWRSFAHFQGLRNSEHAQKEVRWVAQSMLELVKQIEGNPFKLTIEAFKL